MTQQILHANLNYDVAVTTAVTSMFTTGSWFALEKYVKLTDLYLFLT